MTQISMGADGEVLNQDEIERAAREYARTPHAGLADHRPSFQIALAGGRLNVEGSFMLCDEVDSFIEALQVAAAGHLAAAEPVNEAPPKKKKRRAGTGAWRKVTPGSFADSVLKAVIKLKTDDPQKIAKAIGRENAQGIHMAITNMRRGGLLNGVAAAGSA